MSATPDRIEAKPANITNSNAAPPAKIAIFGAAGDLTKRLAVPDTVEAAWCPLQGLIEVWASGPAPEFANYASGSEGPEEANRLIARDGQAWLAIAANNRRVDRGA